MNIQVTLALPDEVMALLRRIADQSNTPILVNQQPEAPVSKALETVTETQSLAVEEARVEKTVSSKIDPEKLKEEIRALFSEATKDGKKDSVIALLQKHGGQKLSDVPVLNLPLLLQDAKDL